MTVKERLPPCTSIANCCCNLGEHIVFMVSFYKLYINTVNSGLNIDSVMCLWYRSSNTPALKVVLNDQISVLCFSWYTRHPVARSFATVVLSSNSYMISDTGYRISNVILRFLSVLVVRLPELENKICSRNDNDHFQTHIWANIGGKTWMLLWKLAR